MIFKVFNKKKREENSIKIHEHEIILRNIKYQMIHKRESLNYKQQHQQEIPYQSTNTDHRIQCNSLQLPDRQNLIEQ